MLKSVTLHLLNFFFKKYSRLLLISSIFLSSLVQFMYAHGTVTYPPSRIYNCYQENPENPNSPPCIAAVLTHGTQPLYDWMEINQPNANGNHMQFVPDNTLASGGRPDKYGGMDQVRSDWVATAVSPGPFTITWTNTAPHATKYYQVYITKEDWTPEQPLTWDNLDLLVQTSPGPAESSVDIPITLPNRTGKHVLYSVWQRSDSPEAFYSTSDIDFGGGTTPINQVKGSSEGFTLMQNYPNPFTGSSFIEYYLPESVFVSLKVYNLNGQEVETLVNKYQSSGVYQISFSSENKSSGIYFYVLNVGSFIETKRMILLE
jgi:predicted carbohydrate-binding protein with CBM5 and CBM33 domain